MQLNIIHIFLIKTSFQPQRILEKRTRSNVFLTNPYFPNIYFALLEHGIKSKDTAHFPPYYNFCNINSIKLSTRSQMNY